MAFTELELARHHKLMRGYVDRVRPPAEVRAKLDISYRISNQSVEIFEVRPKWDDPSVIVEEPVAKATFVRRAREWRIYWQRADLNWHRYDPVPEAPSLDGFLEVVEEDAHHCFFG